MDNLLDQTLERVRRRAFEIWEREGRPEGRDADHWALAKEEVAIEDNQHMTLRPNPSHGPDDTASGTEPVESTLAVESQAEGIGPGVDGDPQPLPVERRDGG